MDLRICRFWLKDHKLPDNADPGRRKLGPDGLIEVRDRRRGRSGFVEAQARRCLVSMHAICQADLEQALEPLKLELESLKKNQLECERATSQLAADFEQLCIESRACMQLQRELLGDGVSLDEAGAAAAMMEALRNTVIGAHREAARLDEDLRYTNTQSKELIKELVQLPERIQQTLQDDWNELRARGTAAASNAVDDLEEAHGLEDSMSYDRLQEDASEVSDARCRALSQAARIRTLEATRAPAALSALPLTGPEPNKE